MGYPYDTLVPAAILLDNPGITADEFIRRLDEVKSEGTRSWNYHEGLHGLAVILKLLKSQEFEEAEKRNRDPELNFWVKLLHIDGRDGLDKIVYEITTREAERFPEAIVESHFSDYAEGRIGDDHYVTGLPKGSQLFRVLEVLKEENPIIRDRSQVYCSQTLRVIPFRLIERKTNYTSLASLIKDHSEYDPKFMYDWSPESGEIWTGNADNQFRWLRKQDGYFLDEQWVRDNVSRKGVRLLETYDWADLILTAEAIRTKFWKVLQRRGLEHMDEFLETHPEVKERYAEAIWDSHTSLFAKQKRMTHTELIRMRLEARINAEVAQRLSEELIKQP